MDLKDPLLYTQNAELNLIYFKIHFFYLKAKNSSYPTEILALSTSDAKIYISKFLYVDCSCHTLRHFFTAESRGSYRFLNGIKGFGLWLNVWACKKNHILRT